MSLLDAILSVARKQDPTIGDGAMVTEMEWGYWVGSTYAKKQDVKSVLQPTAPDAQKGGDK